MDIEQRILEERPDQIIERFIEAGLELLKQGESKKAAQHFQDEALARNVRLDYDRGRVMIFDKPPSNEEIQRAISFVGFNSSYYHDARRITLATVNGLTFSDTGITEFDLPHPIYHNSALVYAEEWLHGIQNLRGTPLAGYEDHEIDVAVYMDVRGVPLTKDFLMSHGRYNHPYFRSKSSNQ